MIVNTSKQVYFFKSMTKDVCYLKISVLLICVQKNLLSFFNLIILSPNTIIRIIWLHFILRCPCYSNELTTCSLLTIWLGLGLGFG